MLCIRYLNHLSMEDIEISGTRQLGRYAEISESNRFQNEKIMEICQMVDPLMDKMSQLLLNNQKINFEKYILKGCF